MAMQADLHDISIDSIIKLDLQFESSLWALAERLEAASGDEKALIADHLAVVFVTFEYALACLERCESFFSELKQQAA